MPSCRLWGGGRAVDLGKLEAHLELRPGFIRTSQPHVAAVEAGELAGEVQAESMAGNIFADGAAMKPLENMRLGSRRNGPPGIANGENGPIAFHAGRDAKAASGPIILSRVFQQILQDDRGVPFFSRNAERDGEIGF